MTSTTQSVIPALRITDCEKSKKFYVDGLGFTINWEHRFEPHFPVFMQVSKGDILLFLSQHTGDCEVRGLVYLYVDNVDLWHQQATESGIEAPEPRDQPWKLREMRLKDPDGNTLAICTRLAD